MLGAQLRQLEQPSVRPKSKKRLDSVYYKGWLTLLTQNLKKVNLQLKHLTPSLIRTTTMHQGSLLKFNHLQVTALLFQAWTLLVQQ